MGDGKREREGLRRLRAIRVETDADPVPEEVDVVVEAALTIDLHGLDSYTLLCTPLDVEALTVGFLFTEGVIDSPEAIESLRPCEDDAAVMRVRLHVPRMGDQGRNLLIASSCGLCGVENVERKLASLPRVGDRLRVQGALLRQVRQTLRQEQELFRRCGGTHAAGIFDVSGKVLAWAEDAGRHNALDKAIGKCLLAGIATAGCGVALSGRTSLDMVGKCARAGIELVSAISAPTTLAVDVAERCGITLCAFVRDTRATVFSHPRRLTG